MFWAQNRPQGFFGVKLGPADAENQEESENPSPKYQKAVKQKNGFQCFSIFQKSYLLRPPIGKTPHRRAYNVSLIEETGLLQVN